VGDVGGGRDKAPHPFGCCAVIMAFARARDRFGTVGPICQRRGASAALTAAARRVSGGIAPLDPINRKGNRGEVSYLCHSH
jgi:hypothetical protein